MAKKVKTSAQVNHPQNKQMLAKRMSANLSGKKKLLCIHVGPASMPRMGNEVFKKDEWSEIWVSPVQAFKPDIFAHPAVMKEIEDGSIDAIWVPHTIKHLYTHEVMPTFKEFFRVLKMDAELVLFTPDLESICDVVSRKGVNTTLYTSRSGKVTGLDALYGSEKFLREGALDAMPRTGFTPTYLGAQLREAGFRDITVKIQAWNLWARAYKRDKTTEENKTIKLTGEDANFRMAKRDNIERDTEKPVDTNFPFKL